jgi:hypothetical protein
LERPEDLIEHLSVGSLGAYNLSESIVVVVNFPAQEPYCPRNYANIIKIPQKRRKIGIAAIGE